MMDSQKAVTASMLNKQGQKILIRKCSKAEPNVRGMYDVLGYRYYLFIQKSALPENDAQRNEITEE